MTRGLTLAGVLGAIIWITVQVVNPKGERNENLRARIWSVAFLGMFMGLCGLYAILRPALGKAARVAIVGLIVGVGLMTLGTAVEYWILFPFPHQGGTGSFIRGLSWMTVLLGALLVALFSVAAGVFCLRSRAVPRWLGLMFLLFLPSTVAVAFIHRVGAALPIACLSSVGFVLYRYGAPSTDRRPADSQLRE